MGAALALAGGEPPRPDDEAPLLASILLGKISVDACAALGWSAESFHVDAHRAIFAAALDLHRAKRAVDVVSVGTWLKDHDRIAAVGGMRYLAELLAYDGPSALP